MNFTPSVHGFPFPNWWPAGTPVLEVPTPFGTIPFGDAHGGVCGGMVFAAADFFHHQTAVPQNRDRPIFHYFCKRLLHSWHLPFGVLKYYDWQRRPTKCYQYCGVKLVDGIQHLTLAVEWPKVKAILDVGGLAPLGLVKAGTWNPRNLARHHQVLAYQYSTTTDMVNVKIYDPNYPNDDFASLSFNPSSAESDYPISHSHEGLTIRGFFATDYLPLEPVLIHDLE